MFETLKILLVENKRSLIKKINVTPVLYFFFTIMMIFSIMTFAFLTLFLTKTEADISIEDMFYAVFFIFLLKSTSDFHKYFIKSPQVSYALSTQVNHKKTNFEIFTYILLSNLGIWFSLSFLYLFFCFIIRININYPVEYIFFTFAVIIAALLGCTISIHFFSPKKIRLIPTIILFAFYRESYSISFFIMTLPIAILHFIWGLNHSIESYLFVNRKKRITEKSQLRKMSIIKALFTREITVLWRDKLLFSFIFTSISTALFSGYLIVYGNEFLLPESLRETAGEFLPSMFLFFGVYIVTIYTSVFPALNLFLNEEKTMWILRNIPLSNQAIVYGKVSSLSLCFITSLPFIPYISIFIGLDDIVFLLWLLAASFIAGIIISVPLGAKYVGKKSDILLLYSIAMILLVVLASIGSIGELIRVNIWYWPVLLLLILLAEVGVLFLSLKLSSKIISLY